MFWSLTQQEFREREREKKRLPVELNTFDVKFTLESKSIAAIKNLGFSKQDAFPVNSDFWKTLLPDDKKWFGWKY